MTKALITFVVLNLVASAAIATLGTLTYLDREALTTEVSELESTATSITQNLKWGEDVVWEAPEEKKPLNFSVPQPESKDQLTDLESALANMVRFSTQRQAQLSLRHNELTTTLTALEEARSTLRTRQRELQAAENQKARLERSLAEARNTLQEEQARLAKANTDRSKFANEVASLNDRITELNNELATLEIDLETRIQERDLAKEEYDKCRYGSERQTTALRGKRGKVLAVNNEWEYVVIDKGMIDNVEINQEAIVHRGDEYIGKLNVIRVEDEIAVAEIVAESVIESERIQAGDTLFF